MDSEFYPKIAIAIPTYNEEENLACCLNSVFQQEYPPEKLQVLVVDDYSTDNTVKIAKKYPVKILYNGSHDAEIGKKIAFEESNSEFFYYLDADCELRGKRCLKGLVKPLLEDKTITASFTRNYARKSASNLERYYSMHPTQCDPIFEFFAPSIASTVIEKKDEYFICQYTLDRIPPMGHCVFRRQLIKPLIKDKKTFRELDALVFLVRNGFDRLAYIPKVGVYHHHVRSLAELLKKRFRRVQRSYLAGSDEEGYSWFNLKQPKDVFKIFIWVIYAHLFFPSLIRGIYKSIKHRDWAGLYEPVVALLVTDAILFGFLSSQKGRGFILKGLSSFGKKDD